MLVLSRKVREAVLIGEDLVITVTRVKGRTVRLAIDAPSGVSIARLDLPRSPAAQGQDHGDDDETGEDEPGKGTPAPSKGRTEPQRRTRVVEV